MVYNMQTTLFGDRDDSFVIKNDKFSIFYRPVNDNNLISERDFSENQKKSLLNVFKSFKTSSFMDFEDISLNRNPKAWIESLIKECDESKVNYLINDFSENMNTNMREKNMYVILILLENELILAHSKMGEKSITPDFKVFDRMLDKDNLMRFVSFKLIEKSIQVKHYEKNKSKFFKEWLGISYKNLYYEFGGENKFYFNHNGSTLVLELKDEEIDMFMDNNEFNLETNTIILSNPIQHLSIDHIQRSNKRYKNYESFRRDFTSRKFNLMVYKEAYEKLYDSLYLFENKFFDCSDALKMGDEVYQKKENENISILFCDKNISLDSRFLNELKVALINNYDYSIIHIADKFSDNPIEINNFKVYNELNTELSQPLINYFNSGEYSPTLEKILLYSIFYCLSLENKNYKICYFFEELLIDLVDNLDKNVKITENEIIELKARDFISGTNDDIIEKLSEDINKKLTKANFKIYFLGYTEKIRKFEPVESYKFSDDRLIQLEKGLKRKLKSYDINLIKINFNLDECIFLLILKK